MIDPMQAESNAQEQLRASERRLADAQRLAQVGSWERDLRTDVLTASREYFRLLGLPPSADGVLLPAALPEDVRWAQQVTEQALQGRAQFSCDFRLRGSKPRHFQARGERICDDAGATVKIAGTIQDITERKQAELERAKLYDELLASRKQLETMTRRLFQIQEDERRRLAGELHDEIGQVLTAVSLSLEHAKRTAHPDGLKRLDESRQIVDRAIDQVRGMSLDLRPAMLDIMGLEATLRWYVERQAGIAIQLAVSWNGNRLGADLESACFRIVQEALTNVVRHAQARQVHIDLTRSRTKLTLGIQDDGVGFDTQRPRERFGLLGMEERVRLLGGRFAIESAPGQGTTIHVRLPLK